MDTGLRYRGKIENDTLKGSRYLIGGFDPEFMDEDLDRLVDALASQGIRYVTDTLAADVSMTDSVYWGSGWCWDDTPYSFQPYLSPLMLNRGCVDAVSYTHLFSMGWSQHPGQCRMADQAEIFCCRMGKRWV